MKSIEASVGAILTHEKKEVEGGEIEEEVEEEEYHQMKNEMIFFLEEAPEYQISAVAEWAENSQGGVVVGVDTYFRHILTGERCESAWGCLVGWSEPGKGQEKWETLCERIENYGNLEQTICDMKRVELYEKNKKINKTK